MTPRHKLTKWDEWEIGAEYKWTDLHGRMVVGKLQEINRKERWILINGIKISDWRNKFVKFQRPIFEG